MRNAFYYLGTLPLMIVPVWAAGGAYKPWQTSFLYLCAWAWLCYFLTPNTKDTSSAFSKGVSLLKDPFVWLSLLFILFLVIQHHNTGRALTYDFDNNKWMYSPPRYPHLPWSITPAESLEMIKWFAPAITLFLIFRHTWDRLNPKIVLWIVCLNGFLNAMLAFVHMASGWEYMYNLQKFGKDVYGSFGYPNHGAIFFILLFAIALGMLFQQLLSDASEREPSGLGFALIWTPVFFIAANLSTSRAGILGSWLVLFLSVIAVAVIAWPRIHPVQRIYGLVSVCVLIGFLVAGFALFTQPIHIRELRNATVNLNIFKEIDARFFQIESAWDIWLDYPWFGVGGWGYRYFVGMYIPQEKWGLLNTGKANVHHDFMQFLVEFGLVGFGLLTAVFLPMMLRHFRNFFRKPFIDESLWANPLRISCMWGLLTLLLISQFDIPLRSPAVFLHAICMMYVLEPHSRFHTVWSPAVEWKRLQPPLVSMKNRIWGVEPESGTETGKARRHKKKSVQL